MNALETTTHRRARIFAALVVAVVVLFCALAVPQPAHAARTYGVLCSKYETDNDPACIDPGSAYGAYQMSPGNAYTFARWLQDGAGKNEDNNKYALIVKWGDDLVSAYKTDGNTTGSTFDFVWESAAEEKHKLFFDLQYQYCKVHYYEAALPYWSKVAPGFDVSNYSKALRCAIFSAAIQHGPYGSAYYIFQKALDTLGGWKVGMAEDDLINAIYRERGRATSVAPSSSAIQITKANCTASAWANAKAYGINKMYLAHFYSSPASWQVSIYNRLCNNERADAIAKLLKCGTAASHGSTTGGSVACTGKYTNTQHQVAISAIKCTTCDAVVQAAKTEYVSHKFEYSAADWACECGASVVIHTKSRYYSAPSTLSLRASASASAKTVASLKAGKVVQLADVLTGTDGNYWGKVTVGKKSGYVRVDSLQVHGSASGTHVFKAKTGKCKYCELTAAQVAISTPGKYRTLTKASTYKATYGDSGKVATLEADTKVRVTAVVTNIYNDYWGLTNAGTYIKLSNLYKK